MNYRIKRRSKTGNWQSGDKSVSSEIPYLEYDVSVSWSEKNALGAKKPTSSTISVAQIKTRDPAQSVCFTGLKLQEEDGTYGTVPIPDGSGGSRLPKSSRFVNPSATTLNVAFGLESDNWGAEVFVDNLNNEDGRVMQVAGHYTPVVSVQRPRTIGLRLSYKY